jgi:hypothetical protein
VRFCSDTHSRTCPLILWGSYSSLHFTSLKLRRDLAEEAPNTRIPSMARGPVLGFTRACRRGQAKPLCFSGKGQGQKFSQPVNRLPPHTSSQATYYYQQYHSNGVPLYLFPGTGGPLARRTGKRNLLLSERTVSNRRFV